MESVREWSARGECEYRFLDDALFEILPAWFLESCRGRMLPLTDLARALHAQRFLEQGWERTVWIDADVLVFLPDRFSVDTAHGYAVCSELWCDRKWGEVLLDRRINNCVSVYDRGNAFLPFYIQAMQTLARARGPDLTDWDLGTNFLSSLGRIMPLPLLGDIAMLSPVLADAVAAKDAALLQRFSRETGRTCSATNLCASALEKRGPDAQAQVERVVDVLLRTRGDALNGYLRA